VQIAMLQRLLRCFSSSSSLYTLTSPLKCIEEPQDRHQSCTVPIPGHPSIKRRAHNVYAYFTLPNIMHPRPGSVSHHYTTQRVHNYNYTATPLLPSFSSLIAVRLVLAPGLLPTLVRFFFFFPVAPPALSRDFLGVSFSSAVC